MSRDINDVIANTLGHTMASKVDASILAAVGASSISSYMIDEVYIPPSLDQTLTGPIGSFRSQEETEDVPF